MLHQIVQFILDTVSDWGYFGIFAMMFLESSFFPFPSEVVMVPAGYLASKGEMNLFVAIAMGTVGALAGAIFNYYLASSLGRKFLEKYGKYLFIKEETIVKMERFFTDHGHISTFSGRLIPGIRQYISLPAGLAKMHMPTFVFYTTLGAGIWVTILALLGYFVGQNQEMIHENLREITIGVLIALVVLAGWYIRRHKRKRTQS